MALNDIMSGSNGTQEMARGNIGSVTDMTQGLRMVQEETLVSPAAADVKSGVQYGVNGNQLTGSYVGEGGGGNIFVIAD